MDQTVNTHLNREFGDISHPVDVGPVKLFLSRLAESVSYSGAIDDRVDVLDTFKRRERTRLRNIGNVIIVRKIPRFAPVEYTNYVVSCFRQLETGFRSNET